MCRSQRAAPSLQCYRRLMPGSASTQSPGCMRSHQAGTTEAKGRQAGEEGVGSGAGGREGGRIDSLSSTGTTELSCHGERGAAGRARGGRRSHMPGEGVSRANPTVLLWQPPQTGLGLRTKAGWGMAGRWAKTVLHYRNPEEKSSPESFPPLSGCLSTLQLGPWTCRFFTPLTSCSLLRTQGQSPRNRDPVPSPGF